MRRAGRADAASNWAAESNAFFPYRHLGASFEYFVQKTVYCFGHVSGRLGPFFPDATAQKMGFLSSSSRAALASSFFVGSRPSFFRRRTASQALRVLQTIPAQTRMGKSCLTAVDLCSTSKNMSFKNSCQMFQHVYCR